MESSLNNTQEYALKLVKVPTEIHTGREESSVASQSTMAFMGDDLSLTNTSDSIEVSQAYKEISLRTNGVQSYVIGNESYEKIEKNVIFNAPQRNILQPGQQHPYKRSGKRNDGIKGYRGRYNKKQNFKINKANNFYDVRHSRKHYNSKKSEVVQSTKCNPITLTRENLSKLDAKSEYIKLDPLDEELNPELTQNLNKETFLHTSLDEGKKIDDFFWSTKRQAMLFKTKNATKKYHHKTEKMDKHDVQSTQSQASSLDSNCGLVNQDSSLRDINMCDNKNDMWHGLTTSDGRAIYISSSRGRNSSQPPYKTDRFHKRSGAPQPGRYPKHNSQLFTNNPRNPKWRNPSKKYIPRRNYFLNKPRTTHIPSRLDMATDLQPRIIFQQDNTINLETPNTDSQICSESIKKTQSLDINIDGKDPLVIDINPENNFLPDTTIFPYKKHLKQHSKKVSANSHEWKFRDLHTTQNFRSHTYPTPYNLSVKQRSKRKNDKVKKKGFKITHTKQTHIKNKSSNFQHPPDSSIQISHDKLTLPYPTRPLISYDDLEFQENMHQLDSSLNLPTEQHITPEKQQLMNTNERRQHVQRLLAESRGL